MYRVVYQNQNRDKPGEGIVSLRFTPLQNLPDGKPALFRLFAAGRTPVPVSKSQISK